PDGSQPADPSVPPGPAASPPASAASLAASAASLPPVGSELRAVRRTFAGIASGGMRDQVDGGIARYSVDAQWHIPHFEKMLFDNAMYLTAAVHWYVAERRRDRGSRCTRLALREAHDTARF